MEANKVILNDEVIIDLTQDTATEDDVIKGKTFHKASGEQAVGTSLAIVPSGTMVIDANGTYDIKEYEAAEVNVISSGGGNELLNSVLDGTVTEISNGEVTYLAPYKFYGNGNLTSVNFPNVTEAGTYVFQSCTALSSVNIPKINRLLSYFLAYASALESIDLPNVTQMQSYALYNCSNLKYINAPKLYYIEQSALSSTNLLELCFPNVYIAYASAFANNKSATYALFPALQTIPQRFFNGCYVLETISWGRVTSIDTYAFQNCYKLTSVILRGDTVSNLSNTNAFSNCYHYHGTVNATYNPDGLKDGYIYVRRNLIEDYKVATNWSTFADQFRAIEDYPEICGEVKYNAAVDDGGSPETVATVKCNIGDLVIASIRVTSTNFTLSDGWTLISTSDSSIGGGYIAWAYKYAESEEESIGVTLASDVHLIALQGATGFVDNGYVKSSKANNTITVDKPEGVVIWAAISSRNAATGAKWETASRAESVFQTTRTYKYLGTILDQSENESIEIQGSFPSNYTANYIVGSLTIQGMDKYETWR